MDILSKLLLVAGLLMLNWQWVAATPQRPTPPTTPRSQAGGVSISPPLIPSVNPTDILVQSIFNISPSCREGEIRAGPRGMCHRIA
ncbi:uncharacterized protein LOC108094067 [Drosophila ficusphila]|uniref:uncharacterized protein LOC108094067 n=1 Tax=Drosophila ficusphila TaxID=30025 RepID=UPI0007E68ECC|nr:uncharacterized protein LOC108094067 [Drosophila ficusphila]